MDFGALNRPGTCCVVVPGLGRSWPFQIGDDAYGPATFVTVNALRLVGAVLGAVACERRKAVRPGPALL